MSYSFWCYFYGCFLACICGAESWQCVFQAHKMRCLYQEAERKNEGLLQEMNEIKLNKDRLKNDYDMLKHEKNQSVFHPAPAQCNSADAPSSIVFERLCITQSFCFSAHFEMCTNL